MGWAGLHFGKSQQGTKRNKQQPKAFTGVCYFFAPFRRFVIVPLRARRHHRVVDDIFIGNGGCKFESKHMSWSTVLGSILAHVCLSRRQRRLWWMLGDFLTAMGSEMLHTWEQVEELDAYTNTYYLGKEPVWGMLYETMATYQTWFSLEETLHRSSF